MAFFQASMIYMYDKNVLRKQGTPSAIRIIVFYVFVLVLFIHKKAIFVTFWFV